jgi:hypothetical protein
MPANVSLKARAIVTAGFANDVEEVNQYAAEMYKPTAYATPAGRDFATQRMVPTSPKVATSSASH